METKVNRDSFRNKLTAVRAAKKQSMIPFSGVIYVNTDDHFNHYTTTDYKLSISIYGYYRGGLVYNKYE